MPYKRVRRYLVGQRTESKINLVKLPSPGSPIRPNQSSCSTPPLKLCFSDGLSDSSRNLWISDAFLYFGLLADASGTLQEFAELLFVEGETFSCLLLSAKFE